MLRRKKRQNRRTIIDRVGQFTADFNRTDRQIDAIFNATLIVAIVIILACIVAVIVGGYLAWRFVLPLVAG